MAMPSFATPTPTPLLRSALSSASFEPSIEERAL